MYMCMCPPPVTVHDNKSPVEKTSKKLVSTLPGLYRRRSKRFDTGRFEASIYPYNYPEELGAIPDFNRTSNP